MKRETYGCAGGPDAIKHVRAQGDGYKEILRIADTHHVARFVVGEEGCAGVYALRMISKRLAGMIYLEKVVDGVHFTIGAFIFTSG